ncbi:DUF2946 family protein [Sinorhizobium fredii]|uniref:DUF2946 family protein n=1 Tax=Rhizobium fredii TaxID=380 RepID=UPI003CC7933E
MSDVKFRKESTGSLSRSLSCRYQAIRAVVLCLSIALVIQLTIVPGFSTSMMVSSEQVDAFGNPICSSGSVDRSSGGSETDSHLACCVLCILLLQLSDAHAPGGSEAILRPLNSNSGMSSTRQAIPLAGLKHTPVWPRAPPSRC